VLKRADHDPNQDAIRGFRNATMVVDSPQCRSILTKSAATHGGGTWPYELADSGIRVSLTFDEYGQVYGIHR
jgi:hypothetical protein